MSLYTPVFPSVHEINSSREGFPENSSATPPGKQRNYVEFLRDVHLFLSTQSDVLSPPSRPNSPMFDHRAQKVRDEIQDVLNAKGDESSSGKWTRVSQTLKLGCVRGRHWSVSTPDLRTPDEDTNWILPDEEFEWIEWEKKREENRRLKRKTNASQRIGSAASAAPDSQKPSHASFPEPNQPYDKTHGRHPPGVSPTVLRAAEEKVRKWQASVPSEVWRDGTSGSSSASIRAAVTAAATKGKAGGPQRSRTLDFTVVKPAAKLFASKRGKGSLSQPTVGGCSTPIPSHKPKSPKSLKASHVPEGTAPLDAEKVGSKRPPEISPAKDDTPKIQDVPETPYLPPSFPTHLKTSTPLPNPVMVVRAKPSPILPIPASSSTPPPSILADPPDDRQLISAEPHAADVSSSQSPQINTVQPGKRSRALSTSLDGIADVPLVTLAAKRLRTLSQNCSTPVSEHSKPMSSNGDLGILPRTQDNSDPDAAPHHPHNVDSLEMALDVPLTPGKNDKPVTGAVAQDIPENVRSPARSVKSYFSAPDSDPADSPMRANLLLESPVSPMLSYAQNPSGFLPQITSTQMRKGSPTPGRTNSGVFGVGYSSQFDIERHVDRVSELLEKEVDFDGWLQDMRTVDTSPD